MTRNAKILIICCAIFICAPSAYAQGWPDTCAHLKRWEAGTPENEAHYKLQYDTLRLYVTTCAASDCDAASAFVYLDGAVQFMSDDSSRFDQYREWLVKVLYLNKACEDYFCSCINAIASTYQFGKYVPLAHLSVLNYLRQYHPNCWGAGDDRGYGYDSAADSRVNINGYTVNNLPPLDSIGLGFLLDKSRAPSSEPVACTSFTTTPNPFTIDLTLTFILKQVDHVRLEIYDILGHEVWGNNNGLPLEAGAHTITLDGKNLPHGTLYARISTGFGEVKTVKFVHE